ncbi:MAG TPA: SDR family oxidoreductase [Candidatus Baltobacteraceae bacterium]|jgi:glucose 1-dehydrogenase|nr:SDR family oxidoreductase [Candidatus Baltobacteraceae bacterium]
MKNLLAAFGVRVEKAVITRETGQRLTGKVAIVTGGDTGIGKAISQAFAREGANVIIDYHGDASPATSLAAQINGDGNGEAFPVGADITKAGEVAVLIETAIRRYGRLDILVNNAGTEEEHPFLEMPLEVYEKVIATDLTGVWLCTQAAAKRMVDGGRGGRIINISSIHEEIAMPKNAPYCAAKAGVRMLARTLAVELAPYKITVNNVCPGAIDTPMDKNVKRDPGKHEKLLEEIPLRRMGQPDEVAAMCVYLASEEASYVTGASLFIDGGMSKNSGSL